MLGGDSGMADSVEVVLARMEGVLKQVLDTSGRLEQDFREMRERVQVQASSLQKLEGLNIGERLSSMSERVHKLELDKAERTGALATVKALYALGGGGVAALGALLARHFGV